MTKGSFAGRVVISILSLLTLLVGSIKPVPGAWADGIILVGTTCSLVDAITAANTDSAAGGCAAGDGPDTIVLESGQTYTLSAVHEADPDGYGPVGLPPVSSVITIQGNGATIARDGEATAFRLFHVTSSGDLTLENLTLSGGWAQGGHGEDYGGGGGRGGAWVSRYSPRATSSSIPIVFPGFTPK